MTIERPIFPPRAESVDSFLPQTGIDHRETERTAGESPRPAQGLSRRHMLSGLAVVLPVALPAVVATTADPIFALIAAKRAADVAHLDACHVLNDAEIRHGVGSNEAEVAFDDQGLPCRTAYEGARALTSTPPTTLAGLAAVLRYVNETDEEGNWPEDTQLERQFRVTTAQAFAAIIQGGSR